MDLDRIEQFSQEIWRARLDQKPIEPLTDRAPDLTIEDAYRISLATLDRRLAEGEKVAGKKIGLTSKVVQETLKVDEPDFGFLTDAMIHHSGATVDIARDLIRPQGRGRNRVQAKRRAGGTPASPPPTCSPPPRGWRPASRSSIRGSRTGA